MQDKRLHLPYLLHFGCHVGIDGIHVCVGGLDQHTDHHLSLQSGETFTQTKTTAQVQTSDLKSCCQ